MLWTLRYRSAMYYNDDDDDDSAAMVRFLCVFLACTACQPFSVRKMDMGSLT